MSETLEDNWVADSDALLPGPAPPSSPPMIQPPTSPKAAMNKAVSKLLATDAPSSDPLTGNTIRHDIRHQPTPLPIGRPSILMQKSTNRSSINLSPTPPAHQFNPLFGTPIGGGPALTPYNFQTSFPPLQPITPELRTGTPKRILTNPVNKAPPAKRQAPTDQASMNDLLLRQNEDMAKEINELKKMITNLGNQMTNSMATLQRTTFGKLDGIHRAFNDRPNNGPKDQNPPPKNNQQAPPQNPTQTKKNKGKGPAENTTRPPPAPTADNYDHPYQTGWGPGNPSSGPPAPPTNTWATVTKNGKAQKDNPTGPKQKNKGPATTKTMIVQRSGEEKNENLNLLHLRNTINKDLIEAKAPESLQITGISWNQKGNMMLYTRDGFQNGDFDLHQAIISKAVAAADPSSLYVNKQETWYKLTVHGVSLETYPDTATGMADLKRELEYCNRDLHIITEPRYFTCQT
ncbi:hypothetical protein Q9L58_010769, partial [Maublancomyces gigas]